MLEGLINNHIKNNGKTMEFDEIIGKIGKNESYNTRMNLKSQNIDDAYRGIKTVTVNDRAFINHELKKSKRNEMQKAHASRAE